MAERRIAVHRVAVRLRGAPVATARAVADKLGEAAARALADKAGAVATLDAGTVRVGRTDDAAAVTAAVARAIAARLDREGT
ncbi:MAG: hypothetical protein IRY94_15450 [Rhodospirillaceae bacterium]|nr:hypothetical protein [Rhodospirillaceae bacterium]